MGGAARCCAARIFHKRNIPLVISRARFLDVDDAFDSVCVFAMLDSLAIQTPCSSAIVVFWCDPSSTAPAVRAEQAE